MPSILNLVYVFSFIVIFIYLMKFEFFFRLKHKWHFTLFTSSCLSLFELGILVYILERLAWSHINTYQSLVWAYDHLFKYIFIGFSRALSDFQEASPPSEKLFAQIETQKVLFSLIIISALISFRHMVFAACNYEKGYYIFRKICRTANKYSEPTEDIAVYLICFLAIGVTTLTIGQFSTVCLVLEPGCKNFSSIPSMRYVFYPYIFYLFLTYQIFYLFLICKLMSKEKVQVEWTIYVNSNLSK